MALLPLAVPCLESFAATQDWGKGLRDLFALQCHQRASRSWPFLGHLLPVCTRCLGVYLGLALTLALGRPRLRTGALRALILVSALVLGLDVLAETLGMHQPAAGLRFATGALLGGAVGLAVGQALRRSP